MSDDEIFHLHRGGHDPRKIYNAYKRAVEHKGGPTVMLAKTVKGYGLGSTQARNATALRKRSWRTTGWWSSSGASIMPIPEEADAKAGKLYRPPQDSPEMAYMHARRQGLGGYMPKRDVPKIEFKAPELESLREWTAGSKGRAVSTTMGFVSILRHLMKDPEIGKLIVPIVPDEGRTFGLESAIQQVGIYATRGTEVQAARCGHAAVVPRGKGRADPGGRDHGSGCDGVVHGGRDGVLDLQGADDSLLYVLLDVRIPARWAT